MARATKALTTGMKILGGGNAAAYTLEHLTGSSRHPQGSFETIVIPYIEIGRDRSCAVQYSDDSTTVSRKHAAIERKGNDVVIKNLSQTNPTLINGRPVNNQYYLNNGDEIQLSMEGPRMRYNVSATGTAKMGVTKRMNLVMQQAVKPYRTAVLGLAVLLLFISAAGGYGIYTLTEKTEVLVAQNLDLRAAILQDSLARVKREHVQDSLQAMMKARDSVAIAQVSIENQKLRSQISNIGQQFDRVVDSLGKMGGDNNDLAAVYNKVKEFVYYMQTTEYTLTVKSSGEVYDLGGFTCTGFLVENNRFITARHCVQSWRFFGGGSQEEIDQWVAINSMVEAGEAFITLKIKCTSPDNSFTLSYNSETGGAHVNDAGDEVIDVSAGTTVKMAPLDRNDWAWFDVNSPSKLKADTKKSQNMKAGEKVVILGYSYSLGAQALTPLLSESLVGADGVGADKTIILTNRGFGQGNSGGPVFFVGENEIVAVGIVSAGMSAEIGLIVPVSECY